jgi:hypothetical protein
VEKSLFEQMGDTYRHEGDYFIQIFRYPMMKINQSEYGGQRHRRYLKQNHRIRYMNLLTSGKLNSYLADIDEQAEEMFPGW